MPTDRNPRPTHTPTPWKIISVRCSFDEEDDLYVGIPEGFHANNARRFEEHGCKAYGQANAELIRDAVNSHAKLLADRAALLEALKDAEFMMRKVSINWKEAGAMADSFKRSAEDARAAIKQAEETA